MNKYKVQKRVLKNGKPLSLDKFTWDEKTRTFSSDEDGLVIDFSDVDNCNFITGSDCTFYTDEYCNFYTNSNCVFNTEYNCTFNTGVNCIFNTDSFCVFNTDYNCTFNTNEYCKFIAGGHCEFNTSNFCTFNTGTGCTFRTGICCTFITDIHCTFMTDFECIFYTEDNCTFNTSSTCTFDTGSGCNFKTGSHCTFNTKDNCSIETKQNSIIIYRKRDKIHAIQPERGKTYQTTTSFDKHPFLIDGVSIVNGKRYIMADGILSQVLNQKGNVYKVLNDGDVAYIIQQGDVYSHGKTLREARESLKYKISNRDTSEYEGLGLQSVLTLEEAIKCYRTITGACEYGVRDFVDSLDNIPESLTVQEMIDITSNQYGNDMLKNFFNRQQKGDYND